MDGSQFDALARSIAAPSSRRHFVRALGGSLLASVAEGGRAMAAGCPSGVVCSAQCCPNTSDICLAGRCTDCPSGVICSARCCPHASDTCQAGRCTAAVSASCGNAGDPCSGGSDCCPPLLCSGGACTQPRGGSPCPPGSRECDGVCYPGGCCTDADCGDPCLSCGSDHLCQSCPAGQFCTGIGCCTLASCQRGQCGTSDNGCGGTLDCGACPTGQTCQSGQCVANCTAATCQPGQCGAIPDGCGGTVECGGCPGGQTCHKGTCCTPTCGFKACGVDDGCGGACGGPGSTCSDDLFCCSGMPCFQSQCCAGNVCGQFPASVCCGSGHTCVNGGCFKATGFDDRHHVCTDCPDCACLHLYARGTIVCVSYPPTITQCFADSECAAGQACAGEDLQHPGVCITPC